MLRGRDAVRSGEPVEKIQLWIVCVGKQMMCKILAMSVSKGAITKITIDFGIRYSLVFCTRMHMLWKILTMDVLIRSGSYGRYRS